VPWILLAALACGHEDPIEPGRGGATGPFAPGDPVRLTLSPGYDRTPSWLPDGSGILHSFDRTQSGQFDRCLGVVPAGGASRTFEFCGAGAGSPDSLDALEGAGASAGGRLMFQWSQTRGVRTSPNSSALGVATLARPWDFTPLLLMRNTLPGGRVHARAARVDWLDEDRAVYLGEDLLYPRACSNCIPDTIPVGREGVLVDLGGAAPSFTIIPGTENATSLAGTPGSEQLYLTLPLDTRVFRLPVTGGVPEVVHDFGALGVVRDVAVAAGRLYAIVGGRVFAAGDPILGTWQEDAGGLLYVLDLASGSATEVPMGGDRLLRRPYPDPTGGTGIAVEGYALTLIRDDLGNVVDSLVSRVPDLWQYQRPAGLPATRGQ
jgi:hypothetical protein